MCLAEFITCILFGISCTLYHHVPFRLRFRKNKLRLKEFPGPKSLGKAVVETCCLELGNRIIAREKARALHLMHAVLSVCLIYCLSVYSFVLF